MNGKIEVRRQKSEIRGQGCRRSEVRGQKSEVRSQRSEGRDQDQEKAEEQKNRREEDGRLCCLICGKEYENGDNGLKRKIEDRGQRSDVRCQRTEVR